MPALAFCQCFIAGLELKLQLLVPLCWKFVTDKIHLTPILLPAVKDSATIFTPALEEQGIFLLRSTVQAQPKLSCLTLVLSCQSAPIGIYCYQNISLKSDLTWIGFLNLEYEVVLIFSSAWHSSKKIAHCRDFHASLWLLLWVLPNGKSSS